MISLETGLEILTVALTGSVSTAAGSGTCRGDADPPPGAGWGDGILTGPDHAGGPVSADSAGLLEGLRCSHGRQVRLEHSVL